MPRHARIEIPGGVYHVISRGLERKEIFRDDRDRAEFVRRLSEAIKETGSKCYGWALMPNHFHLVMRPGAKALSELMRKVLPGYALYFNRRHKRRGYLYQNRYKSILCQEESYLLELIRYVHLNPLRGNIVKDMAELNRYRWAGHAVLMGTHTSHWQSTGEILERFGTKRREAVERYLAFVQDAQHMGKRDDLTGGGLRRSAGGWKGVFALRASNDRWQGDERILGDGDFVSRSLKIADEAIERRDALRRGGWTIDRVVERVSGLLCVDKKDIRRRSRLSSQSDARALISFWANKELGIPGKELADYFQISNAAITKSIKRGEQYASENALKLIS